MKQSPMGKEEEKKTNKAELDMEEELLYELSESRCLCNSVLNEWIEGADVTSSGREFQRVEPAYEKLCLKISPDGARVQLECYWLACRLCGASLS